MTQATDTFVGYSLTPDGPYTDAVVLEPSDVYELPFVTRGLYIMGSQGASAMVKITMQSGMTLKLVLSCGVIHPLRVRQVQWPSDFPRLSEPIIIGFR